MQGDKVNQDFKLDNENPNQTAKRLANKFKAILEKACKKCCSRINEKVSCPKVEKVVKPPRSPTKINNLEGWFNRFLSSNITPKKPIIKQPTTFTVSVPKGNIDLGRIFSYKRVIKYLNTAPIKPPLPTIKTLKKDVFI